MPSDVPTTDTGRIRRQGALVVAAGGLVLVAMIAAAVQGPPLFRPTDAVPSATPPPAPSTSTDPTGLPDIEDLGPTDATVAQTLTIVMLILVAVGLIALAIVVVRALMRAWRNRRLRRRATPPVGADTVSAAVEPAPEIPVAAIRRGIAGALQSVDRGAAASDAIIAAWVGLEESAADAGVRRGPSETPAEYALRIISLRSGVATDAEALLRLYERVRFGTHVADENDRAAAREALRRIDGVWR